MIRMPASRHQILAKFTVNNGLFEYTGAHIACDKNHNIKHHGQSGRVLNCSSLTGHHGACQQMSTKQTWANTQSKVAGGHLIACTIASCESMDPED